MSATRNQNHLLAVTAYVGDAKTLLAFDLTDDSARTGLGGFTIEVHPPGTEPYYVTNNLRLAPSPIHAVVAGESPFSTANAPIHKFRWVHVPGLVHQGGTPTFGQYTYVVTPRYFDRSHALQPLDPSTSVSVEVAVGPFVKGALKAGFTRGYVQSQAYVRHFGEKMVIRPSGAGLIYDTSAVAGTNPAGKTFTYAEEYEWLGFTARQQIFSVLDEVQADATLTLDVFAYDLNEPDVVTALLALGAAGRVRIILDDAALHHSVTTPKPEDDFYAKFVAQAGQDAIKRGKFGRYAHDKVFVVSDHDGPRTVLTGSTNFSVTGLYVNANHVLVFEDRDVATTYSGVFDEAWNTDVAKAAFANSRWAAQAFTFGAGGGTVPPTSITFSPHRNDFAAKLLGGLVDRINAEGTLTPPAVGTVFFAVMQLDGAGDNPVYTALNDVHTDPDTFSLGISDSPTGVFLYPVGSKAGVLVTGRPGSPVLPPPFDQVPSIGAGHEIHHKFVVCGFKGDDPVVYCGSSNLALGGEELNGDNLLAIHDADVATAFTIEALELVDHYNFLDSLATKTKAARGAPAAPAPTADIAQAAVNTGWFLGTTDAWTTKYFDPNDLHSVDRQLFGS